MYTTILYGIITKVVLRYYVNFCSEYKLSETTITVELKIYISVIEKLNSSSSQFICNRSFCAVFTSDSSKMLDKCSVEHVRLNINKRKCLVRKDKCIQRSLGNTIISSWNMNTI